jgi:hypothetical protein
MAVDMPLQVASAVEDRELGALIGRYPLAINRILLVQCRVYGGVFGISFLGTVLGGATGGDPAAIPVAIPLLAISVWLVLLGERIKRNRAFYLYREGIVAAKSSGRIALIDVAENAAAISLSERRPVLVRMGKVPDILVLIHIASSAKTSPGWFSEDE